MTRRAVLRGRPGWRGGRAAVGVAVALGLLAGCATRPPTPTPPVWSGRLALRVDSDPPQRWSALFELDGAAERGTLQLASPLGQTLATVRWDASGAWLERPDSPPQRYDSVAALTAALTGAALPVTALFAWRAGKADPVAGWEVDLTEHAQGRLRARRTAPPPPAELRLLWQP